ncbi:MAG: hypothetical protein P8X50_13600 [Maritimibacter sp.]
MNILKNTPDLLIVQDAHSRRLLIHSLVFVLFTIIPAAIALSGLYIAWIFVLVGGFLFGASLLILMRRARAEFDRCAGKVRLSTRGLFGSKPRGCLPLASIARAEVETELRDVDDADKPDRWIYREALVVICGKYAGEHPLTEVLTDCPTHHEHVVEVINHWLAKAVPAGSETVGSATEATSACPSASPPSFAGTL